MTLCSQTPELTLGHHICDFLWLASFLLGDPRRSLTGKELRIGLLCPYRPLQMCIGLNIHTKTLFLSHPGGP